MKPFRVQYWGLFFHSEQVQYFLHYMPEKQFFKNLVCLFLTLTMLLIDVL